MNEKVSIHNYDLEGVVDSINGWNIPQATKKELFTFLDQSALGKVNRGKKIQASTQIKYLRVLKCSMEFFNKQLDNHDNEKITVHFAGSDKFTAGDIGKYINGFQVLNPELVIFNCDASVRLKMELTVERGRGYVPAEENKSNTAPHGTIFIDSIYTPIKNVKYTIENYRVEQKTDYERLILDIITDGSVQPKEALKEAAKILIFHFMLFSDEKITLDTQEKRSEEEFDEAEEALWEELEDNSDDEDEDEDEE